MKSELFALLFCGFSLAGCTLSSVDCDFNQKPHFCGWKREWFGTRRASWRVGWKIRRASVKDVSKEGGRFAYVRARSRQEGFRSRLRSKLVIATNRSCLFFQCAIGGGRLPYPQGMSLRVHVLPVRGSPEQAVPVWENGESTNRGAFRSVKLALKQTLAAIGSNRVEVLFEAVRGTSSKSYVAIDDVKIDSCDNDNSQFMLEAKKKKKDVASVLLRTMLPAKRPEISIMEIPQSDEAIPSPTRASLRNAIRLTSDSETIQGRAIVNNARPATRRRGRRRKGRRRKGRRNRGRKHRRPNYATTVVQPNIEVTNGNKLPETAVLFPRLVMCDFIEYTQRLKRCMRTFFSVLQKKPHTCRSLYNNLELCLKTAARSCIPTNDLSKDRVDEIVIGSLRNNFRTKQVYCEEEGAFVFPSFAVANLPLQCGPRYFVKLSGCSGPFSNIFQLKHGDPKLCSEYYAANECQRQTTSQECNFDAETMLIYGLNLQYQFAHNPFCLHLPFSSWWPHT